MTTTTFTLQIGSKTHTGRVREMNQDSFAVFRRKELLNELDALLIVADGMGGGKGGEVASAIVAETLPDVVIEGLAESEGRDLDNKIIRFLKSGMERANNNVRNRSVEKRELQGMGTTCTAAILNGSSLTIGHAGDSRAYLLRDGLLRQSTDDHSEVWQEVMAGRMTREEAQKSRFRNSITKCIGLAREVDPDIIRFELSEGDTFLLCSDGLTTELTDSEIAVLLAQAPTAQAACDALIDAALQTEARDNITAIVLRFGAFKPLSAATAAPTAYEPEPGRADIAEDATDEKSEWRNSLPRNPAPVDPVGYVKTPVRPIEEPSSSRNRTPSRPVKPVDEEEDDDFEDEAPRSSRSRRKRTSPDEIEERAAKSGGFLRSICVVLVFLCVALGASLAVALSSRTIGPPPVVTKETTDPNGGDSLGPKPTDKNLQWSGPEEVSSKPMRDDYLEPMYGGNIAAAYADGTLVYVSDKGKVMKAQSAFTTPKSSSNASKDLLIAFDRSGNFYRYDAKKKAILRYDQSGVVIREDIGLGQLTAPTRIALDGQGDLFVIDAHRLKILKAFTDRAQNTEDNMKKMKGGDGLQ